MMRFTLDDRPCSQAWKPMTAALARSVQLMNRSALPRMCPVARKPGEIRIATE